MSQINLNIPVSGQPNSTEDPKVASDLTAIQGVINGGIDASNITDGSITGTDIAAGTITPDKLASGSGSAPFLKLAVPADRKISWGTGSMSLNGIAGKSAGQAIIAHGLGGTPSLVLVGAKGTVGITEDGVSHPVKFTAAAVDATNITVNAEVAGTSTNTASFYYMAII